MDIYNLLLALLLILAFGSSLAFKIKQSGGNETKSHTRGHYAQESRNAENQESHTRDFDQHGHDQGIWSTRSIMFSPFIVLMNFFDINL